MCIFSDSVKPRYSTSANSFLGPLISYVKSIVLEVHVIEYFTDGAASQYKNYKTLKTWCIKGRILECEQRGISLWHRTEKVRATALLGPSNV